MFPTIQSSQCVIPNTFKRIFNKEDVNFMKIVNAEDRLAKAVRNKEIQITAENPQIREQEETTKISQTLSKQLHDEFVDQRKRLQHRLTDLNLRELQRQIRTARVAKELHEQRVAYRKMLDEQKIAKQNEIEERKKNQILTAETLRQQEMQAINNKAKFRQTLRSQMAEKAQELEKYKQSVLEDQKNMRQLEANMKANDLKEWRLNEERKQRQQKDIEKYLLFQAELRAKEKLAKIEQQNLLLQVQKEVEEKEQRAKEAKKHKSNKTQELSEKIGQHLFQLQTEKKQKENELLDLLVEELKNIEDEREKQNLNARMQKREQLEAEYEHNQHFLLFKKNQTKEENERIHLQQKQIAADLRHQEQLQRQKRAEKAHEYAKEIRDIIAANRERHLADSLADKELEGKHLLDEQKRLEEVKDEYMRLSKIEPEEVLKFLPLRHRKNCCI